MNLFIIFGAMLFLSMFIRMLDKFHKDDIKENYSEQKRFADKLLEIVEEQEEEEQEDEAVEQDIELPSVIIQSCNCPVTKFTTYKADYIRSDKTNKVTFGSDVVMGNASVKELTINDVPFAKFDSKDNKIVIG